MWKKIIGLMLCAPIGLVFALMALLPAIGLVEGLEEPETKFFAYLWSSALVGIAYVVSVVAAIVAIVKNSNYFRIFCWICFLPPIINFFIFPAIIQDIDHEQARTILENQK